MKTQATIDPDMEGLLPWDLTLEIRGSGYRTRRPRLGVVLRIQELSTLANVRDALALIGELFEPPGPDLSDLYNEELSQILSEFGAYYAMLTGKNSLAVARIVAGRTTATTATTAKSPTQGA